MATNRSTRIHDQNTTDQPVVIELIHQYSDDAPESRTWRAGPGETTDLPAVQVPDGSIGPPSYGELTRRDAEPLPERGGIHGFLYIALKV
jgi:hypothetical protein